MKLATARLLEKATFALDVAAKLLDSGDSERSVGRSYYAMFYAGEASLCEDGYRPPPDWPMTGGLDVYVPRVKTTDGEYHRWLMQASDERLTTEGGVRSSTPAQAARSIDLARDLIAAVRRRVRAD
jgi:uncharacterized protein (UPF0332 family)